MYEYILYSDVHRQKKNGKLLHRFFRVHSEMVPVKTKKYNIIKRKEEKKMVDTLCCFMHMPVTCVPLQTEIYTS